MKLALGTVQFGMKYGVANRGERVGTNEVQRILSMARSCSIDTLDTAAAYGDSERVLGQVGTEGFRVVSKLPPLELGITETSDWVTICIRNSLTNLNVSSLYGFLLHRPLELLSDDGQAIYDTLKRLQSDGLIKKIGVSVYGPEDLQKLSPHYHFDLVQAPMNIFDRRLLESGWLKRLKDSGTEVHIRSAFLQGVLLMKSSERPAYFGHWADLFKTFDDWCSAEGVTPLQACLGFLNQEPTVDKIVVGVDSADQLRSILASADSPIPSPPEVLQSSDKALINPANWTL